MVERNSNEVYACKLCPQEMKHNHFRVSCIGCEQLYCIDHLVQHRQQLTNEFDRLIKEHNEIKEKSLQEINVDEHLEYIDKWENEMIELIKQHTKKVKEKILCIFQESKTELNQRFTNIEKELHDKRNLNAAVEKSLHDLSKQVKKLDQDIQNIHKSLHQIATKELNYVDLKSKQSINSIEKSLQWNHLHDIKLDSTYAYMAASDTQIYLGWKNRIAIYYMEGKKYDETSLKSHDLYGELCDLIWSSTMNCIFILCRKSIFVHYPSSNRIDIVLNPTVLDEDNHYVSIASYKNKIFLLNEKFLNIFKLANKTCQMESSIPVKSMVQNHLHETICSIRVNEGYLALLIQNTKTHKWRLDTFSIDPFKLNSVGLPFDQFSQPNLGLFMPLRDDIYLFMNWETKLMHMIDSKGTNQIVDHNAYNACLLGNRSIIVVNYMKHLKVYEL